MIHDLHTAWFLAVVCQGKLLKPNPLEAAICTIELQTINKFRHIVSAEHAVLMPHLVWAVLYANDSTTFDKLLMPMGRGQVTAFWESMEVCRELSQFVTQQTCSLLCATN
jgi:hypothetical protein